MSNEYAAAIETHNVAIRAYNAALAAYRSLAIGDAEFFAAKKAYTEATAIYDEAFNKEAASA